MDVMADFSNCSLPGWTVRRYFPIKSLFGLCTVSDRHCLASELQAFNNFQDCFLKR